MFKRIVTGVVALLVLIPFLIFSDTWAFVVFGWLVSVLGIYEMLGCIGVRKNLFCSIPAFSLAILFPVLTRVIEAREYCFLAMFIIMFVYMVYLMIVSVFSGDRFTITDASMTFMTAFYILFGFSSIIILRDLEYGAFLYMLAFIIPWATDTFAYFFGVAFGKHKLIESVSPKKTVEGSLAGTISATLITVIYGCIVGAFNSFNPNYIALIIVGTVCSVVSQCGDLIASLIKRKYNIKDYGRILPGHGGILDRFDSILPTAPFMLVFFVSSPLFTFFL